MKRRVNDSRPSDAVELRNTCKAMYILFVKEVLHEDPYDWERSISRIRSRLGRFSPPKVRTPVRDRAALLAALLSILTIHFVCYPHPCRL
jgi:hypothetical protein